MNPQRTVSKRTFYNWLLDASLALSGLLAGITGVYFLFLPTNGYQGGRNLYYSITILFERATWEDLHIWTGLAMVAVAVVHLLYHWKWVASMARRMWREATGKAEPLNRNTHLNILVNVLLALGFILSAVSGVYFFVVGGSHGGTNVDPLFIFTRTTWDLIHTWSSVVMMAAAMVHFLIHWQWVVKVTRRLVNNINFGSVRVVPVAEQS